MQQRGGEHHRPGGHHPGPGVRARPVSMAVPPELVGWKLYVPVRFMVDAAGLEDVWDAEENTLWITTPEQT